MTCRSPEALALVLPALVACGPSLERPSAAATPAAQPIWFVDIAKEAGLNILLVGGSPDVDWIIDSVGVGGAWLDYDGDSDPDLYLAVGATDDSPTLGPPDRLFRNDGDLDGNGVPSFTDVTTAAGLGDTLWSFGVAAADYDGDGNTDLYLLNWGPNRLYRNNGDGTFTDVARTAGVDDEGWGVSASWSDVDRDGDLDLYLVNYVDFAFDRYPARGQALPGAGPAFTWKDVQVFYGPRGLRPGRNVYFRNDGDPDRDGVPQFSDATVAAGLVPPEHSYGLAALFFDSDDDGDPDLYVANDSLANHYFVNRGDGTFDERGVLAGLAYNEQGHEQAGMGIAAGDYDLDGRLDLVVTNFSYDHDTLYHNDGAGLFTDLSFAGGLGGPTFLSLAWGVSFADLDHDGWEDLFIANGHVYPQVDMRDTGVTFRQANSVFRNTGDGRFLEVTQSCGPGLALVKNSRAVLPVDLDGDGDLDFAVTGLNETPDLLRNDGAPGHWLQVRLEGALGNRQGIGARVTIEAAGLRQTREITSTAAFAGSVLPVAHFGLGGATVVDRLEVRWPSGRRTEQAGVAADRLVVLREPSRE